MTTYPLSEAATVHVGGADERTVRGRGTLEECVALVESLSPEDRRQVQISMDDLDVAYGPDETDELFEFLQQEGSGLSNRDIAELPRSDR